MVFYSIVALWVRLKQIIRSLLNYLHKTLSGAYAVYQLRINLQILLRQPWFGITGSLKRN